jgi:hypothetical protein
MAALGKKSEINPLAILARLKVCNISIINSSKRERE